MYVQWFNFCPFQLEAHLIVGLCEIVGNRECHSSRMYRRSAHSSNWERFVRKEWYSTSRWIHLSSDWCVVLRVRVKPVFTWLIVLWLGCQVLCLFETTTLTTSGLIEWTIETWIAHAIFHVRSVRFDLMLMLFSCLAVAVPIITATVLQVQFRIDYTHHRKHKDDTYVITSRNIVVCNCQLCYMSVCRCIDNNPLRCTAYCKSWHTTSSLLQRTRWTGCAPRRTRNASWTRRISDWYSIG